MGRSWAALLMALMLLLLPIAATQASASDIEGSASVSASVTVKASVPTVTFKLYSDSTYQTPTKEITPQTPVYMKISVAGDNPLSEANVSVDLFADTNANAVGTIPQTTSPEVHVHFNIYYDSSSQQWKLAADTGGSTTWSITLDSNKQQPDPTSNSGDFYVVIIFGKTAREANVNDASASYADWDIVVNVTLGSGSLAAYNTASDYGYTVYFYGEISTSVSSISFGTIEAKQNNTIQEVDGQATHSFSVTVIANGNYDLEATSDLTWANENGDKITLTTSTPPGNAQFALLIDDEENTTASKPGTPLSPVYVTSDTSTAGHFVSNAPATTESGSTHSIYMEIVLGDNIHTGTYTGTIALHVVKYTSSVGG
jgi:hypothetical protein